MPTLASTAARDDDDNNNDDDDNDVIDDRHKEIERKRSDIAKNSLHRQLVIMTHTARISKKNLTIIETKSLKI